MVFKLPLQKHLVTDSSLTTMTIAIQSYITPHWILCVISLKKNRGGLPGHHEMPGNRLDDLADFPLEFRNIFDTLHCVYLIFVCLFIRKGGMQRRCLYFVCASSVISYLPAIRNCNENNVVRKRLQYVAATVRSSYSTVLDRLTVKLQVALSNLLHGSDTIPWLSNP